MDRAKLFAPVRNSVFRASLSQPQADGIYAILDACECSLTDARHIACVLATPMIETGGTYRQSPRT